MFIALISHKKKGTGFGLQAEIMAPMGKTGTGSEESFELKTFPALGKTVGISLVLALLAGCAQNGGKEAITESLRLAAADAEGSADYLTAAGHYRNLLNRQPDDKDILLGLARNLRYSGNAKLAVETLDARSAEFGGQPEFLVELGKAKLAHGKAKEAIGHLKQAIAKGRSTWDLHAALGIGYDLIQSFGEAKEAYGKALELSEDNPSVLNNMAISAALAGELDVAISTLEDAGPAARRSPQIRQNLALFYGIKGDLDKAEALARMDLDEESVRSNLAFFASFREDRR